MMTDARKLNIIGVDAGGSKTEIILSDAEGRVQARALRGTGNPNDVGVDACVDIIADAVGELLKGTMPDALFAGISGAGSGDNAQRIRQGLIDRLGDGCAVEVGTDAQNLLAMGKDRGDTAALICGTGSAIFFERDGHIHRVGGWGYLFDHGGSGYDIGRDALAELLAAEEGFAPYGELCGILSDRLQSSAHDALAKIYSGGKAYIASFAHCVSEAFTRGDAAAEKIILKNVDAVCSRLEILKKLYGAEGELICGGGLFNDADFSSLLAQKARAIGFELYIPKLPQSFGACVRAAELVSKVDRVAFGKCFNNSYKQ